MSRSGYTEDCDDQWLHIRWRGAVTSSFRGARGQAFLKELVAALDEMPVKELHANVFAKDDCFCALGVVGAKRGIDMKDLEPQEDDWGDFEPVEGIGGVFGIADAMAREIMYMNDEGWYSVTPPERWHKMRNWLVKHILTDA